MQFKTTINASITTIGGYIPKDRLTNKDLESIVDTNSDWIQSITGIKEQRLLKDPKKTTFFLAIQANERIIEVIVKRMKLNSNKVLKNIVNYGNTIAATISLLLYDFQNQFKKEDKIVFANFGGGYTWGAAYYAWSKQVN